MVCGQRGTKSALGEGRGHGELLVQKPRAHPSERDRDAPLYSSEVPQRGSAESGCGTAGGAAVRFTLSRLGIDLDDLSLSRKARLDRRFAMPPTPRLRFVPLITPPHPRGCEGGIKGEGARASGLERER